MSKRGKVSKKQTEIKLLNRILVILILFLSACSGTFLALYLSGRKNDDSGNRVENINTAPIHTVEPGESDGEPSDGEDNYTRGDEVKDLLDQQEPQTPPVERNPEGGKKKVQVSITNYGFTADELFVTAQIPEINEAAGTGYCNYAFTKDGETLEFKTSNLPNNANSVICEELSLKAGDDFTKLKDGGEWKLKVTYQSNSAEGESEEKAIQVN